MDHKETALYISDMVLELRNLAKAHDMAKLQTLLEFAYYEACSSAKDLKLPAGEEVHLTELGSDARRAKRVGTRS
jgi:hypothetical protein